MKKTYFLRLIMAILLVGVSTGCYAKKGNKALADKAKNEQATPHEKERATFTKDVFMFGIARSYQDSITYLTNISPIQKAVFDKSTGFIDGLDLYTNQLETHLLMKGRNGYICATFHYKSMKQAENAYLKLRKKISNKKYTSIEPLGDFMYHFVSPENIYRNVPTGASEDDDETENNNENAPAPATND